MPVLHGRKAIGPSMIDWFCEGCMSTILVSNTLLQDEVSRISGLHESNESLRRLFQVNGIALT